MHDNLVNFFNLTVTVSFMQILFFPINNSDQYFQFFVQECLSLAIMLTKYNVLK